MTVRADISSRYTNRMYAYEPSDLKACKYHSQLYTNLHFVFMSFRLTKCSCLYLSVVQHEEGQEAPEV